MSCNYKYVGFPKNLSAKQESQFRSLGQEDPLEKEMATYSSILASEILRTEGSWWATVLQVAKEHDLATKQQ